MSKDEKENRSKPKSGALDKFEPGGELGPLDDRNEYEQRLNSLPPGQKELAQESARMADLCQYFSQQKMDVPPEVLEQIARLSGLPITERFRAIRDINRTLTEYLNDVGQDPGIRQ
jgi:hypothetical protein